WPVAERAEWTAANIEFVRLLRAAADAINPEFVIVNNNLWHENAGGEQFVNGVDLENPPLGSYKPGTFHSNYAARTFGRPNKRRVLMITRNAAEAAQW